MNDIHNNSMCDCFLIQTYFLNKRESICHICMYSNYLLKKHTPRRNAVPFSRQLSAKVLVAFKASSMLVPEAITAHTIAPAEEPAKGVVSCLKEERNYN